MTSSRVSSAPPGSAHRRRSGRIGEYGNLSCACRFFIVSQGSLRLSRVKHIWAPADLEATLTRSMRLPLDRPASETGAPAFETMAFKRLEGFVSDHDLLVILCREAPPTDADWSQYINAVSASAAKLSANLANILTLVLSDGGAPNAMQRTRLTEFHEKSSTRAPVSLISDSPLVRGAARAMALFNPKFKVFAPDSFLTALDHLGLRPSSASLVKGHILEIEQQLGGPRLQVVRAIFARSVK